MFGQAIDSAGHTLELVNGFFAWILNSFQIRPSHYSFMFPPQLSPEEIDNLHDQGVFPKLGGLAPAVTYAILLSFIRFFLQNYLIRVRMMRHLNSFHSSYPSHFYVLRVYCSAICSLGYGH